MDYSTKDKNQLRKRWQAEALDSALNEKPFGLIDNRTDLRGFVIKENITNKVYENVDFSALKVDGFGQFNHCKFINCSFNSADFINNLNSFFENCDFSFIKFKDLNLGDKFISCSFKNSKWNKVGLSSTNFDSCNFEDTELQKVDLYTCQFNKSKLSKTTFKKCELEYTKFNESEFSIEQLNDCFYESVKVDGKSYHSD